MLPPLCIHVLTFSSPVCVHVLTFSSPLIRHMWVGVLMCISELPSPFHQFVLLVALASAWNLTQISIHVIVANMNKVYRFSIEQSGAGCPNSETCPQETCWVSITYSPRATKPKSLLDNAGNQPIGWTTVSHVWKYTRSRTGASWRRI
jgi:hypothetical protein